MRTTRAPGAEFRQLKSLLYDFSLGTDHSVKTFKSAQMAPEVAV